MATLPGSAATEEDGRGARGATPRIASAGILAVLVALAVGLGVVPLVADRGSASAAYLVLYFIVLAQSWNLGSGFTGYINFGLTGFIGVGMYLSAILLGEYRVPGVLAFLAAGVVTAAFALAAGAVLLRIRGPYFAIAMLAVAEALRVTAGLESVAMWTKGGSGFPFMSGLSYATRYYAMYGAALLACLAAYLVATSDLGLRLLAIREDEQSAENVGISTTRLKVAAFVIGAFFAGLGGAVHASFLSYVDPDTAFSVQYTMIPIVMASFGGLGTVVGPIIGAALLQVVNDYAWSRLLQLNMAVFGALMVGLVLFLPQGVVEWAKERGVLPRWRSL